MNYAEALDFILGSAGQGAKDGTANMLRLAALLGNPQEAYPCAHIAGTNGKGSVAAMVAAGLMAGGLRVGLYTSPSLVRYNERIRVDGRCIADDELAVITTQVAQAVAALREGGIKPTFFEIGTAIAMTHFRAVQADVAVFETGLGGRLDSTNIVQPAVSVVTRIGLDHMKLLGDTLEKIAGEKAGIFKPGVPVVLAPQDEAARSVLLAQAQRLHCPVVDLSEAVIDGIATSREGTSFGIGYGGQHHTLQTRLAGAHQAANAATAFYTLRALQERLKLTDEAIAHGIRSAKWPGRLEWMPPFLLDGAHNLQCAEALAAALPDVLGQGVKPVLIVGMMADKDVNGIVACLARVAGDAVYCVAVENRRAMQPEALAQRFAEHGVHALPMSSIAGAMEAARTHGQPVLVAGSLYVVGDVRGRLCDGDVDLV